MLYCLNCIDSIIPNKTPVLKRQNAEIYNISSTDNFVCEHCKTNVIVCNINNNNIQTKDLKINELKKYNMKDDDPVEDINHICFILNFLSYEI